MPDYRRRRVPGGTYFFAVNLLNRRLRLLTDHIDELREAFRLVQAAHPFHFDAVVILPDHLHCLWTLPPGDDDYSTRWQLIKSTFSRGLPKKEAVSRSRSRKQERGIWQRRFWEHAIVDEDDYIRHVDYIHYNPVKHGYVTRPIDWPHSSIHEFVRQGILTADWGTLQPPMDMEIAPARS